MNILSTLNAFAQNCKESLKWRIKSDGSLCVAEIRIGKVIASAIKTNKKQAKLWAGKNLLKIINSNTFLREKFLYYTQATKVKEEKESEELNKTLETIPDIVIPQFEGELQQIDSEKTNPSEIRDWFYHLDSLVQIEEKSWVEVNEVYKQVSEILTNLYPGQGLVIVPVGSFLMGSMRKEKSEIDAILFSGTPIPLKSNLSRGYDG